MTDIQIAGYTVQVDEEDVKRVCSRKWYINRQQANVGRYYFISNDFHNCRRVSISLHRFIMNCAPYDGLIVDHISGDTLDNRKCNLRVCNKTENTRNQTLIRKNTSISKFKGVRWHKRDLIWCAGIRVDTESIYLGQYDNPLEGAKAYDMAAIYYFGDFSRTNFPKENYTIERIQEFIKRNVHKPLPKGATGFWGVTCVSNTKWTAHISIKNKSTYIGTFLNPEEAAKARDRKAMELYGDKAKLNFPKENYIKGEQH